MANTYSQLNVHGVFAVSGRDCFLLGEFRDDLFRYISGIMQNNGLYPLAVGGWLDHVHVFFEMKPTTTVATEIGKIKANSSKWINDRQFLRSRFSWQEGYGSFSYSRSQRHSVIQYIMNQEAHHQTQTFREEYLELLQKFEIPFDKKYIFKFFDAQDG